MFTGKRPSNLGVRNGELAPCPSTPNCVSSQSPDADRYIEPLSYRCSAQQAMGYLQQAIGEIPRTHTVTQDARYLHVEFKTRLMGFVDDVEFYVDEGNGTIHVRSASRLGRSDLGTNRKRVEAIRARFEVIAG